jgi:hypothetical protein
VLLLSAPASQTVTLVRRRRIEVASATDDIVGLPPVRIQHEARPVERSPDGHAPADGG